MNDLLYEKKVECPVCDRGFSAIAVKQKGYKVEKRESDLRIVYKEINPLYYDVWLCPFCGYAALHSHFPTITSKKAKLIKEHVSSKWIIRDLPKELTLDQAIEKYKLALISAHVVQAKSSEIGVICLKIAWLFREKEDGKRELEFLNHALHMLEEAFGKERPPIEGMDESTVMYLIGELYRRTGNAEQAAIWMSKVIQNRNAGTMILELAKEQWHTINDSMKQQA